MSDNGESGVTVSLHGSAVTIEDAVRAGEATKNLLEALGDDLGVQVDWQIVSVQFQCDGCGLLRADRPGPDDGWTHRDGDDFCPTCTSGAA
jgi:hypothetical protein